MVGRSGRAGFSLEELWFFVNGDTSVREQLGA